MNARPLVHFKKTAGVVVGEHCPTTKQLACLNCNIDVKKCKGAEKCMRKQMESKNEEERIVKKN